MTVQEFSSEFDILYNNIMKNTAPGLSEYEKSVLLTQAQEALVLSIYSGQGVFDSFEDTTEVTNYLSNLVKQVTLNTPTTGEGISKYSKFYNLPEDMWFPTYETAVIKDTSLGCKNGTEVIVIPTTQDRYYKVENNPFRNANSRRVLRLLIENKAELITPYIIESYKIRYISKPSPIILEDITEYNITINGISEVTECKLNPAIHKTILNKAVQLAKVIWNAGT